MTKKYAVLTASIIAVGMVTLYLETSPTVKRVLPFADDGTIHFLGRSAVVHENAEILLDYESIERIGSRMLKEIYTNDGFEVYGSSRENDKLLAVYDVKDSLPAAVDRHLENHILDKRFGPENANITMDLKGYSVFILYSLSDDGGPLEIHRVRWFPSHLRENELQYIRYEEQLDLGVWPSESINPEYVDEAARSDMEQQNREQRRERIYKLRDRYME
ncbi:hypothetical protein [Paenibacillus dakarensis]|uniref:hypothetical protein n=1 Tax=Paenibacillus dakarensis TaxID=1527293 RepID=UPI0006D55B5E|nr:hypothetical protein [Paenibacillus dakarensis]